MTDAGIASALTAALELGRQGYACFPCQEDKKPFPGSRGCKDGATACGRIMGLWRRWPGPLIGVATGEPSGVTVLDVDKKHPEAVAWSSENQRVLLPTRVHRTRSGGWHLIYRYLPGMKNSASKIHKGVDVRGEGGYIIWWPAAGCEVLSEEALAPWPEFLIPKPEPLPPPPDPNKITGRMAPSLLKAKAVGLVEFVLGAAEGERNARLYWAACRVKDLDDAGAFCQGLSRNDLLDALYNAALHIGLKPKETRLTLRSALRGRAAA
jgi:Bifunctional DNA primase/polymerase, N-terminal